MSLPETGPERLSEAKAAMAPPERLSDPADRNPPALDVLVEGDWSDAVAVPSALSPPEAPPPAERADGPALYAQPDPVLPARIDALPADPTQPITGALLARELAVPPAPARTETASTAPVVIDLSDLDPTLGFVIVGAAADDQTGYDVSYAGDVNGDGIDDIIIGAPNGNGGTGAAYVIYGVEGDRGTIDLADLDPADGFAILGDRANDKAGISVANAGDVNGDGIDDLIVGARNGDDGGQNAGEAYIVYGQDGAGTDVDLTNLTEAQGFIIIGASNAGQLGYNVSTAGDVNGDGIDDLVVGALGGNSGGDKAGETYVIYGQEGTRDDIDLANLDESDGFMIQGEVGDRAGSVSAGGDINGDGFDDIIVGAHRGGDGGVDAGEVYVIYGQAEPRGTLDLETLTSDEGFIIQGDTEGDYLGLNVAAGGDVNGDGIDDIIAGAFRGDDGGNNAGEAYVIYGQAGSDRDTVDVTGIDPADGFIIVGDAEGDLAGLAVASAGDINGDGIDDILVGARYGDDGGINAGEAYVIYGKTGSSRGTVDLTDLDPSDGFIIQGDAAEDNAGRSVSAAGDVNGDGIDDLIVGAPKGDDGGADAGEAYVIYGFRNPPTATGLPDAADATGGEALALDLSALTIADVDETGDMSIVIAATAGSLAAADAPGITVDVSGDGLTLTLTGTLGDLNAWLSTPGVVTYTPPLTGSTGEDLSVTVNDLDGSDDVSAGTIAIAVTPGEEPVDPPQTVALGGGGSEIAGGTGNDVLSAASGANTIEGGDGDDLLGGGFDNDSLFGGAGNDILLGDNSDLIAGADALTGGTGDDLLEGGGGADSFIFATGDGSDTIGTIALDHDDPAASTVIGADFTSGVDLVILSGFGYADGAEALAEVTDVDGVATFSDQGTTITFAGLTAADLAADDFQIL